jgi:hypothetical protein
VLKKSLSAWLAAQMGPEKRPKHYKTALSAPEQGAEKSAKEFFNTLERF